jgi:High potential iron-sulfur protein
MQTRRRLIMIVPAAAGVGLLAACGQKPADAPAPVAAAPAPTPAAPPPAAAPAPAPVATAPAPAAAEPAASTAAAPAAGAAGAMVDEKDAQATSLGYVANASKVDKAKFTKYVDGQNCSGCLLYQGAAGSAAGPCGIFAGKQVASAGWCSAFNKKA